MVSVTAPYDSIKVFSATKARDREVLGDKVSQWLRSVGKDREIVDKVVLQSSDQAFHCLSLTLFLRSR